MELQKNMTPAGEIISGYKMTNEDMTCRGFQYELGVWYEYDGEIELCVQGFHFCEYPSGPWSYYNDGRIFKCEAEFVIKSVGPGADIKHVAKRIRLVEEITITGHRNTGNGNIGHRNTGHRNIGNGNTGDGNVGNFHSGSLNCKEAPIYLFDKKVNISREDIPWVLIDNLSYLLMKDEEIDPTPFLSIPNASAKKIKELHNAHIAARKQIK